MIHIFETPNAVFEGRQTPVEGHKDRWLLSVRQLSGQPLTDEQWREFAARWAVEVAAAGGKLRRCRIEDVEDDTRE